MPDMDKDFATIDTSNTIEQVLKKINSKDEGGIFLPYIQRDFVWNKERIYSLMDSLMRGYPMGTILIWETDRPVNYRHFESKYNSTNSDNDYRFYTSNDGVVRQYVLDGQQRLQSLYIATHGSYDGHVLFIDLNRNITNNDEKYVFEFRKSNFKKAGWLNIHDFLDQKFDVSFPISAYLKNNKIITKQDDDEQSQIIQINAERIYNIFKKKHNIPLQKLASDISLPDIAEIFVRINSGGVVLDAVDLIMATITGEWISNNNDFNTLIKKISNMGFPRAKEFILQACFAIILGDTAKDKDKAEAMKEKLSDKKIKENFPEIYKSIIDVLNLVSNLEAIRTFEIPSYNPIFILIVYRYNHGLEAWKEIEAEAKVFLFIAFLCKDFAKLTQKLNKALLSHVSDKNKNFNLQEIQNIFVQNKKNFEVNVYALLETKINSKIAHIIMYLFYYGQPEYDPDTMIMRDHIFPRSKLRQHRTRGRLDYLQICDSIVNCELLTLNQNLQKTDLLPNEYFPDRYCLPYFGTLKERNRFIELHAIPTPQPGGVDVWDIDFYKNFLDARREKIAERITNNLMGLVTSINRGISKTIKNFINNFDRMQGIDDTFLEIDDD